MEIAISAAAPSVRCWPVRGPGGLPVRVPTVPTLRQPRAASRGEAVRCQKWLHCHRLAPFGTAPGPPAAKTRPRVLGGRRGQREESSPPDHRRRGAGQAGQATTGRRAPRLHKRKGSARPPRSTPPGRGSGLPSPVGRGGAAAGAACHRACPSGRRGVAGLDWRHPGQGDEVALRIARRAPPRPASRSGLDQGRRRRGTDKRCAVGGPRASAPLRSAGPIGHRASATLCGSTALPTMPRPRGKAG